MPQDGTFSYFRFAEFFTPIRTPNTRRADREPPPPPLPVNPRAGRLARRTAAAAVVAGLVALLTPSHAPSGLTY